MILFSISSFAQDLWEKRIEKLEQENKEFVLMIPIKEKRIEMISQFSDSVFSPAVKAKEIEFLNMEINHFKKQIKNNEHMVVFYQNLIEKDKQEAEKREIEKKEKAELERKEAEYKAKALERQKALEEETKARVQKIREKIF